MPEKPIEQKILDEPLEGEFKKLKKRHGKIEIVWDVAYYNYLDATKVLLYGYTRLAWIKNYEPIIYLNKKFENEFTESYLKDVLRHECLHLLLKKDDDDKKFIEMAKKMGIGLNENQSDIDVT